MARELCRGGIDLRVVTTNTDGPERTTDVPTGRWVEHEGVPVLYGRRLPGTVDLSWEAWNAIRREVPRSDLVHLTAIFSWMNLAVARVARRHATPVVVSPRGSLDPKALAFSVRKKVLFGRLGGDRALRDASAFHVTSEMERDHVLARLPGASIGLVPNGVTIPDDADLARWAEEGRAAPYVLYLGRIHAKKNVLLLVEAWSAIAAHVPSARLVIAGPDDRGHLAEVERRIAELGVGASVVRRSAVAGQEKARLLAGAACLVLPSQTENFGNVVAEALAHGTPVIASTGTPWRGLIEHDCGWWIDPVAGPLQRAMTEALDAPRALRDARGRRGRDWMTASFSWPSVARRMADFYRVVAAGRGVVGDAGLEPTTSCV